MQLTHTTRFMPVLGAALALALASVASPAHATAATRSCTYNPYIQSLNTCTGLAQHKAKRRVRAAKRAHIAAATCFNPYMQKRVAC